MPFMLPWSSEPAAPRRTELADISPLETLVPHLEEERSRLGHAVLGTFAEDTQAAAAADHAKNQGRLRIAALWAVLIVGVLLLGGLVWRLAKTGRAAPPPSV